MKLRAYVLSTLCILAGLCAGPLFADSEQVFRQARSYTVQIRTAVTLPFDGDSRTASVGAGFVVDAERGWVMTNAHVVARSPSKVMLAFRNGTYQPATKVYVDPYLDIAIVRIHKSQQRGLQAARLDCGQLPQVGHPVGAFGHPWKLMFTGTRGIVSGATSKFGDEMLQTDAPINAGNSGGPLISLKTNKVVGINTSSISNKKSQNTNFAVPMAYACRLLHLLQQGKNPSPPQFKVVFLHGFEGRKKLVVANTYLEQNQIDLRPGDEVIRVAGASKRLQNEGQLIHQLRGLGGQVALIVSRQGKQIVIKGKLPLAENVIQRQGIFFSGLLVAQSSYPDMKELNLHNVLMVHYVVSGSTAQTHEINRWDFLARVDGRPVTTLKALYRQLENAKQNNKPVVLVFKRLFEVSSHIVKYVTRTIPVKDLKRIGPPDSGIRAGVQP